MVPSDIKVGFRRKDFSPIPMVQRKKEWRDLLNVIRKSLPGWKIYLKPHPSTKNPSELQGIFIKVLNTVFLDPQTPAETYMANADAIIELPLSINTTLFTASLRWPTTPIISIDTEGELLGDYYKDFSGIDYVTNRIDLEEKLKLIASGGYKKEPAPATSRLTGEEFKNTIDLIQHVTS